MELSLTENSLFALGKVLFCRFSAEEKSEEVSLRHKFFVESEFEVYFPGCLRGEDGV